MKKRWKKTWLSLQYACVLQFTNLIQKNNSENYTKVPRQLKCIYTFLVDVTNYEAAELKKKVQPSLVILHTGFINLNPINLC
jgi:hypothetical protein